MYRRCAAARGLVHQSGLTYVEVPAVEGTDPKECQEWTIIYDPDDMETWLTRRNTKHFGQSKDANLHKPPLDVTNDFEGTCLKAERILNGTFDKTGMDEATIWLLENMAQVANTEVVGAEISLEDFEGKIMSWPERTSTSPKSNWHLGHAKAYFARHSLEEDSEEAELLESRRSAIIDGHLTLMNYIVCPEVWLHL